MRDILLGPFGSMGSLNVKLRNICVEDLILEGIFAFLSIIRIFFSTRLYELIGAMGSFIGTSMIAFVAGILVMDGSCCKRSVCTCITDWKLMKVYYSISYIGIAASVLAIVCEIMTLFDRTESKSTAIDLPVEIGHYGRIREREVAVTVLVIQVFLSIPWRIYAIRVIRGVLEAIHCAEVLKFPAQYSRKILEELVPVTGAPNGVEIAVETDIPVLAVLQYQAFSAILRHIGLPPDRGPALIEAQWRAKGPAVLKWWLGRVGVVRDSDGHVIGALSLQLPGDTAAYRARMVAHETLDTSTTRLHLGPHSSIDDSTTSNRDGNEEANQQFSWPERQVGCLERMIGPEYVFLGLLNGYRYRYKHAILNDHVCTPGEAYVEFVCTLAGREGEGIGTRLMKWAEQSAERLGCGRIRLTVMDNDERLRVRYMKYGYQVCSSWTDPIDKMFKKYGFGINENGYCEMEKPLLVDQGKAIHSSMYGFASDRVKLSGSFEDDADVSLHAAAQSLFDGTRDFMFTAQNFISRRNQGGVASWTPLDSCFQDLESNRGGNDENSGHNNTSNNSSGNNNNNMASSIHSVYSTASADSGSVGFSDVSTGSVASLYDKVVQQQSNFSPVSKLGELADPSVRFGSMQSTGATSASNTSSSTSAATRPPLSGSSSTSSSIHAQRRSPDRNISSSSSSSVSRSGSRDKNESPVLLRTSSGSPSTSSNSNSTSSKTTPPAIKSTFTRTAASPTKQHNIRSASPRTSNTATSNSTSGGSDSSNTTMNPLLATGVPRTSSGESIESSSSSHSHSSTNSNSNSNSGSGHGNKPGSSSTSSSKGLKKIKFVVAPLANAENSASTTTSSSPSNITTTTTIAHTNSGSPDFKGKLLSRSASSSVNDENNRSLASQPLSHSIHYEDDVIRATSFDDNSTSNTATNNTASTTIGTTAGNEDENASTSITTSSSGNNTASNSNTSRVIDGRALVQSI